MAGTPGWPALHTACLIGGIDMREQSGRGRAKTFPFGLDRVWLGLWGIPDNDGFISTLMLILILIITLTHLHTHTLTPLHPNLG